MLVIARAQILREKVTPSAVSQAQGIQRCVIGAAATSNAWHGVALGLLQLLALAPSTACCFVPTLSIGRVCGHAEGNMPE